MVRKLGGLVILVAGLGLAVAPYSGVSQGQEIVFSEVNVSGQEASLHLELAGGEEITAAISNGQIFLNGEVVGEAAPGDPIEASWRALLGRAIASDPGELSGILREWTLPEGSTEEVRAAGEILRDRLADALAGLAPAAPPAGLAASQTRAALRSLLQRSDRLRELASVIEEVDSGDLTIHLGESVRVEAGETMAGPLLFVDGDVNVEGRIEGDVILIGGTLDLGSDGRIIGTVRTTDAEISGDRTRIDGGVVEIVTRAEAAPPLQPRDVEATIRDAVREATADARRDVRDASFRSSRSPFRSIGRGIAGLLQTLVTFGIVFGAGLTLLYFFPRHLQVVSQAASGATMRSLVVGLAGLVFAVPLWIVGVVLLAISIIGIPLLLIWIPAVPIALAAAIAFGYVAVARNVGGWFSSKELSGFEGLDRTRPAVQIATGLVILLGAFALANVLEMGGPLFGVFEGLLMFLGTLATMAAASIGLGAVILTRAGRDPDLSGVSWRRARRSQEERAGDESPVA